MQNLSMLYLGVNSIQKLDFKGFPKALTELWLFDNRLTDLNLDDVFLPALAVLDLRRNFLKTIDLKAVFVDLPGLKFLPIARNQFKEDEVNRIITELNQHNVSHYYGLLKADCSAPEEFEVSNICLRVATEPYQEIGKSIWKALVLLVFGVILVGMFVGSLRWIWYQFRY
ncbi:AGAP013186-PA-like protein [Anopheles sinensis]|uniref:AGAP013186-PA-like protein n=1 Tax=Anopheles sinensis TaxID=74873 RepID=A0A084VW25_ANOSI|nr:AGAP013186-PA-like protein [Anopheles sinensis]